MQNIINYAKNLATNRQPAVQTMIELVLNILENVVKLVQHNYFV